MKPRNWKEMMEKVELAVNTLNQSLIAITTFYLTWYCFHVGFNELIVYHVFLTTLGYQFLMAEGILAMYNRNTYTLLAETKAQKTAIHWILQAIGGILAIAGVIIQIISRFRLGKAHFSLIHSIVGKIYCATFALQLLPQRLLMVLQHVICFRFDFDDISGVNVYFWLFITLLTTPQELFSTNFHKICAQYSCYHLLHLRNVINHSRLYYKILGET